IYRSRRTELIIHDFIKPGSSLDDRDTTCLLTAHRQMPKFESYKEAVNYALRCNLVDLRPHEQLQECLAYINRGPLYAERPLWIQDQDRHFYDHDREHHYYHNRAAIWSDDKRDFEFVDLNVGIDSVLTAQTGRETNCVSSQLFTNFPCGLAVLFDAHYLQLVSLSDR